MNFLVAARSNRRDEGHRQGGFALTLAVLLVTVQVVLAGHAASHLHYHGEAEDCGLCILDSQFVAQPAAVLVSQAAEPVLFLSVDLPADLRPSTFLLTVARAPPGTSV